jgi:hypothetical protein
MQVKQGFDRRDEEKLKEVFDEFAVKSVKSGGGASADRHPDFLLEPQFRQALERLQVFEGRDMKEMFNIFDTNEDGCLDFEEFKQVLQTPTEVEEWTKSLPLHHLLADALPRYSVKSQESKIDALENLTKLSSTDINDVATAFSEGLSDILVKGIRHLKHGIQSKVNSPNMDKSLNGKFSVFTMNAGLIDDFHAGLSGRIGVKLKAHSIFLLCM